MAMTREQYDAMTDQQRLDYIRRLESVVDEDYLSASTPVNAHIDLPDDVPAYIVETLLAAGINP